MEYSGFGVSTMPADALAPKVARTSAGMVLAMWGRQYVWLFHSWFYLLGSSQIQDTIQSVKIILYS